MPTGGVKQVETEAMVAATQVGDSLAQSAEHVLGKMVAAPSPTGQCPAVVAAEEESIVAFADNYLTARLLLVNTANRCAVVNAVRQYPAGLPAKRDDVDIFVSNLIGASLGRK